MRFTGTLIRWEKVQIFCVSAALTKKPLCGVRREQEGRKSPCSLSLSPKMTQCLTHILTKINHNQNTICLFAEDNNPLVWFLVEGGTFWLWFFCRSSCSDTGLKLSHSSDMMSHDEKIKTTTTTILCSSADCQQVQLPVPQTLPDRP